MTDDDKLADAMKDQLRKDVAAWSSARADGNNAPVARSVEKTVTRAAPRAATKTASAPAAPKGPFRMSYDGQTDKDYIAGRIKLGAR